MTNQMFPISMIIGTQKAGTTALFEYLKMHPEIIGAKNKEIHFFNSQYRYDLGLSFYKSQFAEGKLSSLRLDASPSYLSHLDAPKRIFDFCPDVKMIVLLRDPVSRAYSAWQMYIKRYQQNRDWFFSEWLNFVGEPASNFFRRKNEEIDDFYLYVKSEIEFMKNSLPSKIEAPVLNHGYYEIYLKRYFKYFRKEQILIIENSELRLNQINILRSIENFLGIGSVNWGAKDLSPIFEGGYSDAMPKAAIKLLAGYFAPYNKRLFEMLGRSYMWQKS